MHRIALSICTMHSSPPCQGSTPASAAGDGPDIVDIGNVRVLVVEDDPIQVNLMRELFASANVKNAGHVTFHVTSTKQDRPRTGCACCALDCTVCKARQL